MSSLADFAAEQTKETRCPVCSLPPDVLQQVVDARRQEPPIFYRVITDWLRSQNLTVGNDSVSHHFKARH